MPHTLIVRHTDGRAFLVMRPDGKTSQPVALTPPDSIAVEGRSDSHLLQDLGWYLERFLDYPFPPNTEVAERIQEAIEEWGKESFSRLFAGVLWLGFEDIRSAEFVVNALVEALFGHAATAAPLERKLPALIQALRESPVLIVWDNFESAAGIEGTEVTPQLSAADRQQLKALIKDLRGGRSKLLLTSRSPEPWLTPTDAYRLPLGGLQGEERWEYCNAVVADLGLKPKRDDADYAALMDALDGHPLAMRAVLLRLGETPAEALLAELEEAFAGAAGDESTRRVFAALGLLDRGLPETFVPLLQLIGLHRRYVDSDYLEQIAQRVGSAVARENLDPCLAALETGGLLHHEGQGIYRMHPALSGFLAGRHPAPEAAQWDFVDFMGRLADQLAPKALHEQRFPFAIHGASFHQALGLAAALGMDRPVAALTQSLAAFAQNRRDFTAARQLFEALAKHAEEKDNQELLAGAYHQLGRIAQEQRDFASAGTWSIKATRLYAKLNDPRNLGIAVRGFGRILQAADSRLLTRLLEKLAALLPGGND